MAQIVDQYLLFFSFCAYSRQSQGYLYDKLHYMVLQLQPLRFRRHQWIFFDC